MGRLKKPIEQHKRDGTFRDDRHLPDTVSNYAEKKTIVPMPPASLPKDAEKFWYSTVGYLIDNDIYTDGDNALIETLCMRLHIQERAYEELKNSDLVLELVNAKGAEYRQINPASTILNSVTDDIIKICAHLGMSPTARTNIGVNNKAPNDPLKNLLKKK